MNWRDPDTNLVHIVDYGREGTNMWATRTPSSLRVMVCGLDVNVTRDGLIEPFSQAKPQLVLRPWSHTQDPPTCLACIGGETLVVEEEDEAEDYQTDPGLDGGSEL